jgi:hydrogenase maturation factor HypF (carbamoyltransferase family)
MITEVITFWGIVQGVGFRPTLSRIAAKYRMRGQVRNMGAFVQLIVTDELERIDMFIEAVQAGKPRLAEIMSIDREIIDTVPFDDFRIVSSAAAGDEIAAVPPDVAVCDECLAEFRNATDPRYRHPFISCVNCGPRYTIMERLPYDRDTTTMEDFPMCAFCKGEYTNPASRRYHAQTVSCHNCGPKAIWQPTPNNDNKAKKGEAHKGDEHKAEHTEHKGDGSFCAIQAGQEERSDRAGVSEHKGDGSFCAIQARQEERSDRAYVSEDVSRPAIPSTMEASEASVSNAIAAINDGGVIALKGVGGYYFVCSPYDENAVRKLREIKVREYKPFAVMFASVEQAREYCEINPDEEAMLTSPKRPIVLLERQQEHKENSEHKREHKRDDSFCAIYSDEIQGHRGDMEHKGDGSFCVIHSDEIQEHKEDSPFDRPAKRAGIRTACSMSPWDIPIAPLSVGGSAPSRRASGPVTPGEVIRGCAAQGGEYPPPRPSACFTRFHGRNDFGAAHGQKGVVHPSCDGNRPILSAVPFVSDMSSTSRFIGAFLPSMTLQYMLVEALGPLIMTSANISDLPIIKDDEEMFAAINHNDGHEEHEEHEYVEYERTIPPCSEEQMDRPLSARPFSASAPLVTGVLYNERRIVRRLDDSVVRVIDGTAQLIRRSKGWTPVPVYVRGTDRLSKGDQILAAGADLKNAFALTKGSFVYMSQYIGDMDNVETERVYADNLASMCEFFKIKPLLVACDMHPLYRTVGFAKEYARDTELLSKQYHAHDAKLPSVQYHHSHGAELLPVQHHHAHVASVMAEHGLKGPVIGVAFDGTGYGVDGTIWGGEILICEGANFERFSHLRDILMIGGDASMRDGWKSAVCRAADYDKNNRLERDPESTFDIDISYAVEYAKENDTLREYEAERKTVEAAVGQGVNTVRTSSMGRLFDAVASLLGICHVNRYEGECAIMLENAADRALRSPGGVKFADTTDALALRFHLDVARAILGECRKARSELGTNSVCLSGGVFQNKILMERTLRLLRTDGFTPYYNIAVPPNDGGIALGQAYVAMQTL